MKERPTKPPPEGRADDGEKEVSLRLRGSRGGDDERKVFSGFKRVMRIAKDGPRGFAVGRRGKGTANSTWLPVRVSRVLSTRRCAVRLTYAKNKKNGQWRAFGRYLERESATGRGGDERGFDATSESARIAPKLEAWQASDDPNLFKLIISPEDGHALDLREFTRDYMTRLESALGTQLQWVAADHYNTDDPHVHLAIRGIDDRGRPLVIPREFIKADLRVIAQQMATARLGHRTAKDVLTSRERQIDQDRFTELDRILKSRTSAGEGGALSIDFPSTLTPGLNDAQRELRIQLVKRLAHLEQMGLADNEGGGRWQIAPGFERVLRDRQQANDRLKVMHSNRALISDPRLPLAEMPKDTPRMVGRLLSTGYDDAASRPYMLLESTTGSVIYLYQTNAAEKAREQGLKVGDVVVVTTSTFKDSSGTDRPFQRVRSLGAAEALLKDRRHLTGEVLGHVKATGQLPAAGTWGGWLGDYQKAVAATCARMLAQGRIEKTGEAYAIKRSGSRGQER